MRLGRGLWVSGGPGIVAIYVLSWMLAVALATAVTIGLLIACAIGLVIQLLIKKKRLRKRHQDDVALFQRIAAHQVEHVEYFSLGRTDPPTLWGVYLIEPSYGSPYAKCGQHPGMLRKLWLENRRGTVHELMVLPDKPMAVALRDLVQRGVFRVKPNATSIVSGFAANDMPILQNAQP